MNADFRSKERSYGELDRSVCTGEKGESAEENPQARGGEGGEGMEIVKAVEMAWEKKQNK